MGTAEAPVTVRVTGVSKRYPIFRRRRERLAAFLGLGGGHWKQALEEITFEARSGEAVGIIGENGSGKSTLLRIVAGIARPDSGQVKVEKPVAALLELGLGFHPDFTGRENAILYGSLLGIPREQMRSRLDAILDFADLGDYADQPLRSYSSGMAARLAFAVATQVDPAVLVVDEALAVGDEAFQRKCIARMQAFKGQGRTVLFCSHAMYQVVGFCERALWLHQGRVAAWGPAWEVVHAYETFLHRSKVGDSPVAPGGGSAARVEEAHLEGADGYKPGQPLRVVVRLRRWEAALPLHVAIEFRDPAGITVATFATAWDGVPPLAGGEDETVALILPGAPFARGPLDLYVHLADTSLLRVLDTYCLRKAVQVESQRWQPGFVEVPHRWEIAS
jgi:lipopolysaccharide transport system ATP-binding protein